MHDFDKLWNYNEPGETEQKFRDVLANTNAQEKPEYALELRTQIARTLSLQQKFEDAHKLLDQVDSELKPEYPIARIRHMLERGRTFNSSGKKEESIPLFLEAWELGLQAKADFYAVDAAHMLGIAAQQDQQLLWNEKAMNLAENSPDKRAQGWLGSLYNNIGWTYHDMQEYDQALEIFLKAQGWREAHEQVRETQIAKWCVARTHRSLGHVDKALEIQYDLEKEMQTVGQDEDGYVLEEIAECLTLQGKPQEAASYFMKAWTILSQDIWLKQNEAERLNRLKKLGSIKP
ncbi:MAG: tetratricopeptide repeat protein [FCB group bacterium]|nr:tetratricopeptide repeat protein [FCB group bacterium]MBL7029307.1 tetratricopeptide repeat protein [Candidatus Neomarinimicrobiota bacterium]MBL7122629.1 tetratricopeptide repeat protein [Candidatus Neomarinimicrobiota bacterium]